MTKTHHRQVTVRPFFRAIVLQHSFKIYSCYTSSYKHSPQNSPKILNLKLTTPPQYAIFPGAQQQLQQYGRLIVAVVQAVIYPDLQSQLQPSLEEGIRLGWGNQVKAIRRILSGERDEAVLCEPLNFMEAAIIRAILEGIAENA